MHALRAEWPDAPIIEFSHVEESFSAASLITAFEASRNHREIREQSPYRYSAAIASRLDSAAHVSPTDYALAKTYQGLLTQQLADSFVARRIDVLVVPCTPVTTLGVGEESVMLADTMVKASDAAGLFTRPFSLAGYPVLMLPAEATEPRGCALQLIGRPGEEHVLLSFAREVKQRLG
jgi:aspartyl-tRNA(Asn)/glutamyl-tRNA(Gln) amidotransferase subunit A